MEIGPGPMTSILDRVGMAVDEIDRLIKDLEGEGIRVDEIAVKRPSIATFMTGEGVQYGKTKVSIEWVPVGPRKARGSKAREREEQG